MTKEVLVATYGSLRSGQANYHVNSRAGGESIGEGWTCKEYQLGRYRGAYFPVVTLGNPVSQVRVEVFKTTEDGLHGPYDALEGFPSFYNRTQVPVRMDDGTEVMAWIYHIERNDVASEVVKHGDWVKHLDNM
ncbi:putative gamma-glutamylcyclotransferase [Aeromonas phage LAh_8]|uniref:Gamma-glutamylcyclotransferase AIG2-like domain-containing protein n=3 Tax=Lahexavirus TaxID=2843411 RepID=A0A5B9N9I4_9CAUD|nr:gamma-glutamyl cyclotransferase [Aeromonas phage 4_4572]YP_009847289.1 gamma-glutamyl cyclotransferase [Aeromonas phage LAh_6]YP_009847345.1 gamma-glutamyl cyclotransferase [Aeromonas phage LAh_8]QDH46553.1 putative gamma-glutamylcyclotransferase [Aeromonas phage LAh_6]QDH46789.1 putative gamma-glutamylcyclotransferase [Aeromonas phage LAh_8]QEG09132.1 hypothetical protein [Aeromonas phage 4_4572]